MAKYRYVYCNFWADTEMLELTPEEKYFYLYLLTNEYTTQCGIYEISYKQIEFGTGYNRDTVAKLVERFEGYDKVRYNTQTKEMAIKNWAKYNLTTSPKVLKCVQKELERVRDRALIQYVYPIKSTDKVYLPYIYPIDRVSEEYESPIPKEKEKIKEKETEKEIRSEAQGESSNPSISGEETNLAKVAQKFEEVFIRMITPFQLDRLKGYIDDGMEVEVVLLALEITAMNNKDSLSYTEGILNSWFKQGVKTIAQAKAAQARFNFDRFQPRVRAEIPKHYQGIDFSVFREN